VIFSGLTVASFVKKGTSIEDIIIVYDDVAFELGALKISHQSSAGGHNGITSIINSLGTKEFLRIRLGIKSAAYDHLKEKTDSSVLADFVLKKFLKDEESMLPSIAQKTSDALVLVSREGKQKAMTAMNAS
jgi:PTH1 family peptidyl-tRNA hydrolase